MLKFSSSAAVKKAFPSASQITGLLWRRTAAARDKLDRGKEEGGDGSVHSSAVAAS